MRFLIILSSLLCCVSCELKVESKKDKTGETKEKSYKRNPGKIRNGIQFRTKGDIKVEQAYLTYDDDGSLVGEENFTELNRKLKLNLLIRGWQSVGGRVFLEASEKVTNSEGETVLDVPALFESNGVESVSEKDAGDLYMNVVITKIYKLSDYFLVEFHLWNKKADQSVEGRYKFHLDNM
jgi:hypothetical protein